jgi:hypothetical protein
MVHVTLAYTYVVLAMMLAEINYCVPRLHLHIDIPVNNADIQLAFVGPPDLVGFSGRIDVANYSFAYFSSGRLRFITKLTKSGAIAIPSLMAPRSGIKPSINKNAVYRLAINYLAAIAVDTIQLEHDHKHSTNEYVVLSGDSSDRQGTDTSDFMLRVNWDNVVVVTFLMPSGELLELRRNNDSYSRRPVSRILDINSVLSIPDNEFLHYSIVERRNLVARFATQYFSESASFHVKRGTNSLLRIGKH